MPNDYASLRPFFDKCADPALQTTWNEWAVQLLPFDTELHLPENQGAIDDALQARPLQLI